MYIENEAGELAIEIGLDQDLELDCKAEAKERPEIVIRAFLKVVELNDNRAWDQFLIEHLFIPSLKNCSKLPDAISEMPD